MVDKVRVIWENLKVAKDRQRSYTDPRRRDVKHEVGDKLFLRVSLWKGIIRFGKKGKLSPRYIDPYEIVQQIGPVAYKLALPPELEQVHNVFHVNMLRRCRSDPSHVITGQQIEVKENITYVEEPVKILDKRVKELRNRRVLMVKVLWKSHAMEEATWETEEKMKKGYHSLFKDVGNIFKDKNPSLGRENCNISPLLVKF